MFSCNKNMLQLLLTKFGVKILVKFIEIKTKNEYINNLPN